MVRRTCDGCGTEFDDDREPAVPGASTDRCPDCGHDNGPAPATAADGGGGDGDAVRLQVPAGADVEIPALGVTLTVDAGSELRIVGED
jgi:hypothetical protein